MDLASLATHLQQPGSNDEPKTMSLVYDELHAVAARLLARERKTHTLQATALVNEVWIKLMGQVTSDTRDRAEMRRRFLTYAARGMRQLLIDHARKHNAAKHGGDLERVTFFEPAITEQLDADALLDLESAIQELEQKSERLARLAELRLFAGLSPHEAAAVLGVSKSTAIGDWTLARAMLSAHLDQSMDRNS